MPDDMYTVIPLKRGLRELAKARGEFATVAAFHRALGRVPGSPPARGITRRLYNAGYVTLTEVPSNWARCQGAPIQLTLTGWRAYRRHYWRDPQAMDVGVDPAWLNRACSWRVEVTRPDVEPDPVILAKLLQDNELGSSGV